MFYEISSFDKNEITPKLLKLKKLPLNVFAIKVIIVKESKIVVLKLKCLEDA